MVVDGRSYSADLIIHPQKIDPSWWRKEGHQLTVADLETVFRDELDALIIGTGFFGMMQVREEVQEVARSRGLELHIEKTAQAVRIFNEISVRKRTAGAFHLTC
jgi:hypothetical protein